MGTNDASILINASPKALGITVLYNIPNEYNIREITRDLEFCTKIKLYL